MNYKDITEIMGIESMKHNIAVFGNDRVYRIIEENFTKAKVRLAYRKFFIKAGGIIPKKKL